MLFLTLLVVKYYNQNPRRTICVVRNTVRQGVEIVSVPHRITESISCPEFPATQRHNATPRQLASGMETNNNKQTKVILWHLFQNQIHQ